MVTSSFCSCLNADDIIELRTPSRATGQHHNSVFFARIRDTPASVNMAELNLGPLYVISITLVDGDVERNLPEVHIPQYLTYLNAEIIVRLVEEALDKLSHYPLTPGPGFNPLLDLLEENADYWTVEMDSGGDSLAVSFCPVHNTVPQETERPQQGPEVHPSASGSAASLGERSSDSEQPAAAGQNNREAGSRRSNTSTEQNQAGTMEESKRKRKTNDTSEATETKRRKTDQLPETDIGSSPPSSSDEISFDNKQPGPSGLNNREIWTHQHQSSTSQEDAMGGVKRKRTSSDSSEGEEPKKKEAGNIFNLSTNSAFSPSGSHEEAPGEDEQPGTGKRRRKSSERKRKRDLDSDSD